MTSMTDEEWKDVQEALVIGGLRACIDGILARRFCDVSISEENRQIIEKAYDHGVTLMMTDDYPWFAGVYENYEVMLGLEHNGTLYSIVTLSSGDLVAVIEGRGLLDNEGGIAFHGFVEAKAYVKGLTAK